MERRIQEAEERVINSSTKRETEADELRRELEEARMAERMAKIQLEEARGPLSPPLSPSTSANNYAGSSVRSLTYHIWPSLIISLQLSVFYIHIYRLLQQPTQKCIHPLLN